MEFRLFDKRDSFVFEHFAPLFSHFEFTNYTGITMPITVSLLPNRAIINFQFSPRFLINLPNRQKSSITGKVAKRNATRRKHSTNTEFDKSYANHAFAISHSYSPFTCFVVHRTRERVGRSQSRLS